MCSFIRSNLFSNHRWIVTCQKTQEPFTLSLQTQQNSNIYIERERNSNNNSNHHGRATERGCFEMCRCGRRSSRYDWRLAVVFTAMTTTTTIIFIVIVILQLLSSSSSNIYNNIYNITNDIITIHNNAIMCSPSLLTIHFFHQFFVIRTSMI